MPLGINGYNDTFKAFADFAAQATKGSTIAQVGGEKSAVPGAGPLAGRTIVAKTGFDFVGNVGRRQASRDVNNEVRELFKQAIADMFGGPDNIPDSVKDAMKMADFGKGKPLTARRILAVKTAVDQVAADEAKAAADQVKAAADAETKMNDCIANGKDWVQKNYSNWLNKCDVNKLIETAFSSCNGNTDAMDIVNNNLRSFLVDPGLKFRSEEYVQKRAGGLAANLNELKAASAKNPGIYECGKEMLERLGKPLPQGILAKIIDAVGNAPIENIRKLSGSSPGLTIHKTMMEAFKTLESVMVSSGADKKLEGADERDAARQFIMDAMLARCGKGDLEKIKNALTGNAGTRLRVFYDNAASTGDIYFPNESETIKEGTRDVANFGQSCFAMMVDAVSKQISRANPGAKPIELPEPEYDRPDINRLGGDRLKADIISLAKEVISAKVDKFVESAVEGHGKGAESFKEVLRKKLDGVHEPDVYLHKRLSTTANAMMNWTICSEMKKLSTDGEDNSFFKKDIDRGIKATLKAGDKTITLANDFETARNQLAQFVTGDPNATYKGLAGASDKSKVHLLMVLLSQETEKAGENGSQYALDPREGEEGFSIRGFSKQERVKGLGADTTRTFTIAKNKDGGFSLKYTMDKPIAGFDGFTEDGQCNVGEGSKFKCGIYYYLKASEFNRLAELDYTKFDDTEGEKIFSRKVEIDGTKQFQDHKLEKVLNTFPQEFKIEALCDMNFSMTLNPTEEEEIAAQQVAGPIVA